jgi:DNA repair protein RecO (recombination protein O)
MAVIETEGCVLRSMEYRESDLILSVLTGEHGRVDVIARGAKKSFKRFGGHLSLFNHVRLAVDYKLERELHSLRNAKAVTTFPGIQEGLLRFASASYLGELSLKSAMAGESEPRILQMILVFLKEMSECAVGEEELLLRMGEVKLLALRGVLPDYTRCGSCGASLELSGGVIWKSEPDNIPLCIKCQGSGGRVTSLDGNVARALYGMRVTRFSAGSELACPPGSLRGAGMILRELEYAFLGTELKSAAFLDQMLPALD